MEFEVLIEITKNSSVKYELDKETNRLVVDRFLYTAMFYPFNYGFICDSLANDGDPLDALVITNFEIIPGAIIKCRAIGGLKMEDEAGKDEKIIAVPVEKVDPFGKRFKSINDLDLSYKNQIRHFFENYKTLEPGKWVKITNWFSKSEAEKLIKKAKLNYSNKDKK